MAAALSLLSVALGGALGALGRYAVNSLLGPISSGKFPLGTLVVNVAGSILIGICYVLIFEKLVLAPQWRNFLMIGFLGAFTTFSSFSLEALALWQNSQPLVACLYVFASLALCLAGVALAVAVTRLL